jgi:hypothetical protein
MLVSFSMIYSRILDLFSLQEHWACVNTAKQWNMVKHGENWQHIISLWPKAIFSRVILISNLASSYSHSLFRWMQGGFWVIYSVFGVCSTSSKNVIDDLYGGWTTHILTKGSSVGTTKDWYRLPFILHSSTTMSLVALWRTHSLPSCQGDLVGFKYWQ